MAFHFHSDPRLYFEHQRVNAEKYVIPFIEERLPLRPGMRVLEIGCGEGGVLKAFLERGLHGAGVELNTDKLTLARGFLSEEVASGRASLLNRNIYDLDFKKDFPALFDLVVLKDVIEHIPDQERLMRAMRELLAPGGHICFGFPPWHMPFGGHQQICRNKLLSMLPYMHLLPAFLYRAVLRIFGEPDAAVKELLELQGTGISIERFERLAKRTGYTLAHRRLYLINPIYEYKFGLKPREQYRFLSSIPFLRNFFTTCAYYLIRTVH